jgi:hypothetical protein
MIQTPASAKPASTATVKDGAGGSLAMTQPSL